MPWVGSWYILSLRFLTDHSGRRRCDGYTPSAYLVFASPSFHLFTPSSPQGQGSGADGGVRGP